MYYCYVPFLFNDTATTEIYTLSLHDALPIWRRLLRQQTATVAHPRTRDRERTTRWAPCAQRRRGESGARRVGCFADRKSTRLNSSHSQISYAVFCLKKKKKKKK